MKILVSGASGLLGSALASRLVQQDHELKRLTRTDGNSPDKVSWDPSTRSLEPTSIGKVNAVVHLAGEPIAEGRWTAAKKKRILGSRKDGTRLLAETVAGMTPRPEVFVSASAIGIYGNRGEEILNETSRQGEGFLADVCRSWEQATEPAANAGIRVVHLRFGLVLSPKGGILRKLIPVFRFGLGGRIGSGRQWMSWVSVVDAVESILFALQRPETEGAMNVVSPNPVRNREFTRALAHALKRPAPWWIPSLAIQAGFGEMGRETALSSANVEPGVLLREGFEFQHPRLETALSELLGGTRNSPANTTH